MNEWIMENLQILATLGSALGVYFMIRMGARKESAEIKQELGQRIDKLEMCMGKIELKIDRAREDVQSLDSRVARIEGQLSTTFPPRFEPKVFQKNGKK